MSYSKAAFTILFCAASVIGYAQKPETTEPPPDNTKVNKRDRSTAEPTADQQKMNATDRQLTKKIRQSVMADKSLSIYAHNVKIISQNGLVTLKGPVNTNDEKLSIVAKAVAVTGDAGKVTDEISVKK